MPAHYIIDAENRVVLTIFRGVLTVREAVEQRDRLHNDPAFNPDFCELIDFNAVSETEMGRSDFTSFLAMDPFSTASKHALVANSLNSVYGAAGMYRTMRSERIRVRIFKTISEALHWLAEI
jgi:hypothetical protein